jgi:extradiol dioxygenase family protein
MARQEYHVSYDVIDVDHAREYYKVVATLYEGLTPRAFHTYKYETYGEPRRYLKQVAFQELVNIGKIDNSYIDVDYYKQHDIHITQLLFSSTNNIERVF